MIGMKNIMIRIARMIVKIIAGFVSIATNILAVQFAALMMRINK